MVKLCRTENADLLANRFEKMKPGAVIGGTVLMGLVFFIELIVYAFLLMDSSPFAAPFAIFSGITLVLLLFRIYIKQKNADGEFMVYIMDDNDIVAVNVTRACKNDTLFGAQVSISFRRESSNWHKIIKNLRKIETSSHFDEFITRPDVVAYSGYNVLRVIKVTEGAKRVKVRARLKPVDNSSLFSFETTKTLRIPKSFTNSDELLMKLRGMQ